jgi:hypothetical protein
VPQIELVPVPLYSSLQPYQVDYDNLPLKALMTRMRLINDAVDIDANILRNAVGSQGSLDNRLNQSINDDGTLKRNAIDEALHGVGAHLDGVWTDGITYVRMMQSERAKLTLIADEATNMTLEFDTPSTIHTFDVGPIAFIGSDGITWSVTPPNKVQANLTFPISAAHKHYYGIVPQYDGTPDFRHYKTGYPNYITGSLRVTINGTRIFEDADLYTPGPLVSSPWTLNKFTGNPATGQFVLDAAITLQDVIRVDFDVSLA